MLKHISLAVVVLLAACGGASPTGLTTSPPPPPPGLDPIVLGINHAVNPVFIAWYAQSGLTHIDTFPGLQNRCLAFVSVSPIDSVRFVAWVGDTLGPGSQKSWSPWFDPRTGLSADPALNALNFPHGAEFWTMTAEPNVLGGIASTFQMTPDSTAPCVP